MQVSVIITYYNSDKHVQKCIDSVLQSNGVTYEIIVIDDNSKDSSCNIARLYRAEKRVKYTYLQQHIGISESRNVGAAIATGTYNMFLDVDRRLVSNTLSELVTGMDSEQDIGIVQPLLLFKDGSVESSGHFFSVFGMPYNWQIRPKGKKFVNIFGARGAIMIRAAVFHAIDGYDEDHRFNGEDTDLSWRTWLSGYRVCCSPRAITYHYKEKEDEVSERMLYRIFFSGPKTVVSMVLKNTPLTTLVWMLPLCFATWCVVSFKLLAAGKPMYALWIYRGIGWNIVYFSKTMNKRILIQKNAHLIMQEDMYGSMSFNDLVRRAISWGRRL